MIIIIGKAASAGVLNMPVDVGGGRPGHPVVRVLRFFAAAALNAAGQIEVVFDFGDAVQQFRRWCHDEGGRDPQRPDAVFGARPQQAVAGARLRIDAAPGVGGKKIDRHLVIPRDVEPLAEVLPFAHRQLQKDQVLDGRLQQIRPCPALPLGAGLLDGERDVSGGDFQPDSYLVGHSFEGDQQPVALPRDGTGVEGLGVGRMEQDQLSGERRVLSHGEHGCVRPGCQALLPARFFNQAARHPVSADHKTGTPRFR